MQNNTNSGDWSREIKVHREGIKLQKNAKIVLHNRNFYISTGTLVSKGQRWYEPDRRTFPMREYHGI